MRPGGAPRRERFPLAVDALKPAPSPLGEGWGEGPAPPSGFLKPALYSAPRLSRRPRYVMASRAIRSAVLLHAAPHPGPLPQGEGASFDENPSL